MRGVAGKGFGGLFLRLDKSPLEYILAFELEVEIGRLEACRPGNYHKKKTLRAHVTLVGLGECAHILGRYGSGRRFRPEPCRYGHMDAVLMKQVVSVILPVGPA